MKVFSGVSCNDGEKTVQDAVVAILERAQEQRLLSSKWSLAELQLDQDDFEWLCDWATNLSGILVRLWLEVEPWRSIRIGNRECSRSAALGSILLLFTAETARRQATEGILWATFPQVQFPKSTLRLLYANGQPTRSYKDAVEAAARWLNLRHVFGIEGLQNWFDTVYLQFGFTYRGFVRSLPEWLTGQGGTQAIQHLLAGQMRSETFCALWDALRGFRRSNIKLEQLKTILARNPWVLPEWTDELATQATARIELGQGGEIVTAEAGDSFEPFLDEPILRWNLPQAPQFICHVSNIAKLDLSESTYYITVAEHICARLQRDADGIYICHPYEEIVLPVMAPFLVITLISATGQIVSSTTLCLWDMNDELTVFRASSGRRIDAWRDMMRSEVAYFVITTPDIMLSPEPSHWHRLDAQGTKLSLLEENWQPTMSAQLEGQVLWQPSIMNVSKDEDPYWARSIDVSLSNPSDDVSFGDLVQAIVRHPKETKISYIRLGAKAISFSEEDAQYTITEPVAVSPDMLLRGSHIAELCFTFGVRKGAEFVRVSRALSIAIVGAAVMSMQGWAVLQPDITMTVEQAKTLPVQIFRPKIKQWALLEGDVWIGRPHYTPHPIGSLAGLGAPVSLRQGPYNAFEKDMLLVREVVDNGIIAGVDGNISSNLSLRLVHPIEVDTKHQIIIWNEDGEVHTFTQTNAVIEARETSWSLKLPLAISQPLIIAIAYDGIRLGTWWHSSWFSILQKNALQDPKVVAALLRWFQLPLLSDRWFSQVQQFACRYGGSVLPVWVADNITPIETMLFTPIEDRWLSAVRTLFKKWKPNDMAVRKIVSQLGGTSESLEELLLKTAWRLLSVDPLLMGKIVLLYARNVCLPQKGSILTRRIIQTIIASYGESVSYGDNVSLQQKKALLLEDICSTMDYVDENFIKRGLIEPALQAFRGKELAQLKENNVVLALSIKPFRLLLGIQILETIVQILGSGR